MTAKETLDRYLGIALNTAKPLESDDAKYAKFVAGLVLGTSAWTHFPYDEVKDMLEQAQAKGKYVAVKQTEGMLDGEELYLAAAPTYE